MSICTAKYILTTDVYVASMQRHYSLRLRREFKILLKVACALLLALVVFLTFVGIVLPYDRPAPYWAFALIAMISVYGLVHDRVNVWHWKRRFRKNPHGTNNEVEWTFANDAVRMKTPLGEATVKWEAFVKIIDLPDGFLFYHTKVLFSWIPFTSFESDQCVGTVRGMIAKSECPFTPRA